MELEDVVCDFVHIKRNGTDGTAYPLIKKSELVLGKDDSCDFKVQVPSACDRHAKLRVDKSGKVFVRSLVSTVPVSLNGADVLKETAVADKSIISVGSCNFRFVYREGFVTSPLQECNKPMPSPSQKRKSVGTPKSKEKENAKTPRSARKSITHTPRGTPKTTPATPTPLNKSRDSTQSAAKGGARPTTPISARQEEGSTKKKGRVPTPTVARARHSSLHSSLSSLSSSLLSIAEETTPQATPTTTPKPDLAAVTPPSKKAKRTDTPTLSRSQSSRSRNSCSSMSTSLVSIREEDESLASPVSPTTSQKPSTGSFTTAAASANLIWLKTKSCSKTLSRRSVSFGPALSPEVFNKHLPPSTPVKAGKIPGGVRRSLPARTKALGFVAEVGEEEGEVVEEEEEEVEEEVEGVEEEEEEEEEEVEEYSMTGFEEASSSEEDTEEEEEESPILEMVGEGDTTPTASPVKQPTLPTPIRGEIHLKPSLKQRYKKLATPLRRAIQDKPRLRSTRRALPTPLRRAIRERHSLHKTHRSLPTPTRSGIHTRPNLRKTRKALATPIRQQIQSKPELRKTKRCLPTPLRQEIQADVTLKKTKRCMPTPVRKEIQKRPTLRKTMKSMPTPVRAEIESRPSLRKTRQTLATPVRRELESRPSLRKTRQMLATPVRREIESMPTLRKTKKSMPTPVRKGIESCPTLRKTKTSLPTPLREGIQSRPALRVTKKCLPTPLRHAIRAEHTLRKTKRSLPTPLRAAIQQRPALQATKKSLPVDLLEQLNSQPTLRKAKPTLPTPLREGIKQGVTLRSIHTEPQTEAPEPRPKRAYADTMLACETPVPAPPAKRRRIAKTPLTPAPFSAVPPASSTTPRPPAQPSKRDYATTVLPTETPVPAPPAKKMKIANSSTPRAYDFGPYLQPKKKSPAVDLTGLSHLFKSPRVCNSTDPADVFEVRLFGGSHEVNFASPVAIASVKPPSRPTSAQDLHSCLKNTTSCRLFTIGAPDPVPQRGRGTRTRRGTAAAVVVTRVTRSRSVKQTQALPSEPPTRKRGRSATNIPEKENSQPPASTKRSTRSRAATVDTSETKSVVAPLPATGATTSRRSSRLNKTMSATQETVVVVPSRPRRRATVMVPIKENAPSSNSDKSVNHTQSQVTNNTEGEVLMTRQSTRRSTRNINNSTPVQAEKPVTESELSRPVRESRRLAGVSAPPVKPQEPIAQDYPSMIEVTKDRGPKKTRQGAKQETTAVEDSGRASTRSTRSSKVASSTAPIRRSSRLRK